MPTTDVAPVTAARFAACQEPAVPENVEPVPKLNHIYRPIPLVVSQVPDVSPAIVTDFCSQVFATDIVYVKGKHLSVALFLKEPLNVPVNELLTQKLKVTVLAVALPKSKSAMLYHSIG